jgi:hypothetical protein
MLLFILGIVKLVLLVLMGIKLYLLTQWGFLLLITTLWKLAISLLLFSYKTNSRKTYNLHLALICLFSYLMETPVTLFQLITIVKLKFLDKFNFQQISYILLNVMRDFLVNLLKLIWREKSLLLLFLVRNCNSTTIITIIWKF